MAVEPFHLEKITVTSRRDQNNKTVVVAMPMHLQMPSKRIASPKNEPSVVAWSAQSKTSVVAGPSRLQQSSGGKYNEQKLSVMA